MLVGHSLDEFGSHNKRYFLIPMVMRVWLYIIQDIMAIRILIIILFRHVIMNGLGDFVGQRVRNMGRGLNKGGEYESLSL